MTVRIAITGSGVISAAGGNLPETLINFRGLRRKVSPHSPVSGTIEYPVFEVESIRARWRQAGIRTLCLALCAAEEALDDAGLTPEYLQNLKVGVCLGTTVAGQLNDIGFYGTYRETGRVPMGPVNEFLRGTLAEEAARLLNLHGPCSTIVNACSSGADAIGVASFWLKSGLCDIAIAGGADELHRVPITGFGSLGILSKSACKPFDRNRDGLNLGEGAGVLVLEPESSARRRRNGSFPALAGFGTATDAYHLTAPHPDGIGLETAITTALAEAGIGPEDISFVNAHGTGTLDNDKVEAGTLAKIFGPGIPFLSTKGRTGHTLGAAGGLEAAFTAAALRQGWIPASAGFSEPDPDLPIEPVRAVSTVDGRYAISTSLAFGGNNTAVVISLPK